MLSWVQEAAAESTLDESVVMAMLSLPSPAGTTAVLVIVGMCATRLIAARWGWAGLGGRSGGGVAYKGRGGSCCLDFAPSFPLRVLGAFGGCFLATQLYSREM